MIDNIGSLAGKAGREAYDAQLLAMDAFKLDTKNPDKAKVAELGKALGMSQEEIDRANPVEFQIRAQQNLSEKSTIMQMLTTIISKIGEMKQAIIQNIKG